MSTVYSKLKCIPLLETGYALQQKECMALGIENKQRGVRFTFPDGRINTSRRIVDLVKTTEYGNQIFSNDSYYRFDLGYYNEDAPHDSELSDYANVDKDCKMLWDYVLEHGAYNIDSCNEHYILFEVCW